MRISLISLRWSYGATVGSFVVLRPLFLSNGAGSADSRSVKNWMQGHVIIRLLSPRPYRPFCYIWLCLSSVLKPVQLHLLTQYELWFCSQPGKEQSGILVAQCTLTKC